MRITDRAMYALDDSVVGQSRLGRVRMYLSAGCGWLAQRFAPNSIRSAPVVLAHEDEVVDDADE